MRIKLIILSILLITCNSCERKNANLVIENAKVSNVKFSKLPYNIEFGQTVIDINKHHLYNGQNVSYKLGEQDIHPNLYFKFFDSKLYELELRFDDLPKNKNLYKQIAEQENKSLIGFQRFDYKNKGYYRKELITKWIKDNQIVELKSFPISKDYDRILISYTDAPIAQEALHKTANELLDNYTNIKIKASTDGSVYEVTQYLKKNLRDPKSYESIEWGKLKKNGEYYEVRHKFRAKNGFGGYTIENKIFIINNNGEVVNVEPTETESNNNK